MPSWSALAVRKRPEYLVSRIDLILLDLGVPAKCAFDGALDQRPCIVVTAAMIVLKMVDDPAFKPYTTEWTSFGLRHFRSPFECDDSGGGDRNCQGMQLRCAPKQRQHIIFGRSGISS